MEAYLAFKNAIVNSAVPELLTVIAIHATMEKKIGR